MALLVAGFGFTAGGSADAGTLRFDISIGTLTAENMSEADAAGLSRTMPGLDYWIEFDVPGRADEAHFRHLEYWYQRESAHVGENLNPVGWNGTIGSFPVRTNLDPRFYETQGTSYLTLGWYSQSGHGNLAGLLYDANSPFLYSYYFLNGDDTASFSVVASEHTQRILYHGQVLTRVRAFDPSPVPLPASALLLLAGILAMVGTRTVRRQQLA